MKLRWKVLCLLALLVLDAVLFNGMYRSYQGTKALWFSAVDGTESLSGGVGQAGGEAAGHGTEDKQVALTFDDGPHSIYTSRLLDGLRERGVHATFFLLGENIDGKEAIIRQMKEDGHLIGNHGYTHVQMSKEALERARSQIEETNRKIEGITGQRPEYLRPPYGSWNDELESATDMTVVLWSLDPVDWKIQDTGKVVRKILKTVEPGDIIILHDVFPTSVQAALEVIDTLKKQGYTFVTVDEFLVD